MSGILTTARLVFKDSPARDTAIEAFRNIIAFTQPHGLEVLQYVCALPKDDIQGNEIYMIEEYANQAASDAHLATKPVQDLIQLFTTGDILAAPPEVHNCAISVKKSKGPPLSLSASPAVVLLHTTSANQQEVRSAAHGGTNHLNAIILVEDKETNDVRAQYVLNDWKSYEAFESAEAAKAVVKKAESVVKIRPIAGFLGREDKSRL